MTEGASGAKKVLLISYHFPPSPAVGGLRAVNFAKNLPENGWQPVVLTIADVPESERDESRLADVAHVEIIRARAWPTIARAYNATKRFLTRSGDGGGVAASSSAPASTAASTTPPRPGLVRRLRRFVLSLLAVPDYERGWIIPAALSAIREVRRQKIACVVSSCPPYSVHVVGLLVKIFTGVRWIADFRDPWMSGGSKSLFATSATSLRIDRWLERMTVARADVIVANTPALQESLHRGYPSLPAGKLVTITNSIDTAQFAKYWRIPKNEVFTITHAGSLYFNRSPEPLFAAVRDLVESGATPPNSIRIVMVGQCDHVGGVPTVELARKYNLEDAVDIRPPVAHAEALDLIRRSHLALLLAPAQPRQVPAKAYEYIGLGTHILALAGPGATADLVVGHGVGSVFEPADVTGIKGFLLESIARKSDGAGLRPHAAELFDAGVNTRRLAVLLEGRG